MLTRIASYVPNLRPLLPFSGRGLLPGMALVLAALLPFDAAAQGYGGTVADMLVRGEALLTQNRPNEAIAQFQEARTLCPTAAERVQSLQGEGRAQMMDGKLLAAAGLFEEAATVDPQDPRAADLLFAAGQARQRGGEMERSIDLFRKALDHHPTPDLLPVARFHLARALRLSAKSQEALDALKDFETSFPDHALLPMVLYTRAIINHDLNRLPESETTYRIILEKYPNSAAAAEAHFEMGAVLAGRGKTREAAEFYRKYVALRPAAPEAAAALERAADLLLFRAPKESAQLYGLAAVKAAANPQPGLPELQISRWLPTKRAVASALARVWVVVGAVVVLLAAAVLAARFYITRRRRKADVLTA